MSGSIEGFGDLQRISMRFRNATTALHDRLLVAMQTETEELAYVARQRLAELFPNPARMQQSIESRVTDGTTFIYGEVEASGLPYLRIHEYGGTTAPHDIFPVRARALHFFSDHAADAGLRRTANTQEVFARHVAHPGSHMPERSFMRYALAQRRNAIRDAFLHAASTAIQDEGA